MHADGRVSERAFLASIHRLNGDDAGLVDPRPRRSTDAAKAVEYIRNFAASWAKAKPPPRATMTRSLYEEFVVRPAPSSGTSPTYERGRD
jgi:hypothetical protein